MPLVPSRLTRSALQDAIDARPANAKLAGDVGRSDPFSLQRRDLSGSCPRCRFPVLVFSLGRGLCDALPLPFEHQFTLEAGNSANDGEHQATGRCAGVSEIQNAEVGPLGSYALGNF